jgi:hypothetical protein
VSAYRCFYYYDRYFAGPLGHRLPLSQPAGHFVLKAASGEHWCGENSLFGGDTDIVETGKAITFASDEVHTVGLQPHPNGNLPLRKIGRAKILNSSTAVFVGTNSVLLGNELGTASGSRKACCSTVSCTESVQ